MEQQYLSATFQARQMPTTKLRKKSEKPDMNDLPLFSKTMKHEEQQTESQMTMGKDNGSAL